MMDTFVSATGTGPVFVRIVGWGALVVRSGWLPKLKEPGARLTAGPNTVNASVPVVPPGVVILTILTPAGAVAPIVNVVVSVDPPSATARGPTVIKLPSPFTDEAHVKPLPVTVTGTIVPCAPVGELIAVRIGVGAVTVNAMVRVPSGVATLIV